MCYDTTVNIKTMQIYLLARQPTQLNKKRIQLNVKPILYDDISNNKLLKNRKWCFLSVLKC